MSDALAIALTVLGVVAVIVGGSVAQHRHNDRAGREWVANHNKREN